MSSDPFAKYRVPFGNTESDSDVETIPEEGDTGETAQIDQQEDFFAKYRPKSEEEQLKESIIENAFRQGGRSLARAVETVIGAPRALGDFLESIVPEKALVKGAEKVGLGESAKTLLETTKKYAPFKLLPKSEDVREVNKFLFGSKLEPQSQWEEKADEVISDFTAFALPLPGGKLKVLKPALLSIGGNIASEITKMMGGSKDAQTKVKLGTIFVGSLAKRGGAKKLGNELYAQAREARPPNVRVTTPKLETKLNKLQRELRKGGSESWKPKLFTKIDEIKGHLAGNNIEVGELEKFKPSINNIITELYAEKNVGKPAIKSAQRYTNQLAKVVDDSLSDYAKVNPQWGKVYREANQVHGAIAQSNKVRNFISKSAKKVLPHYMYGLFGLGHKAGAKTLAGVAGTATAGSAALESGALLTRIYKSPRLRKYYFDVVKGAIQEDATMMQQNLDRLQKELEKS